MIPIGPTGLDTDGTLNAARLTAWRSATSTFISTGTFARLVVWKRPTPLAVIPDGGAYDVTAFSINDKVAQLRSRRD
jgi:hypothetical protein